MPMVKLDTTNEASPDKTTTASQHTGSLCFHGFLKGIGDSVHVIMD
jgi:hypothetical protein